jgi:hypothetical protein
MTRLDRITSVFLFLAGVWAMAQFALAFFVHVTERAKLTTTGWVVPPTKTYIQAFAVSELVLTVVVLGVVAFVGTMLHRRMSIGELGAGWLAWSLSIATLLFGVVGFRYLFGVGIFLCLACASARRRLSAEGPRSTGVETAPLG